MQITEIYKSLQGESTHAGLPCVFVRLTGCNLRCSWCDSEYTVVGGKKMGSDQVWHEVKRLSPNGGLVEITGGEPMLQERELVPFMRQLLDDGYRVLLETSGERPLAQVLPEDFRLSLAARQEVQTGVGAELDTLPRPWGAKDATRPSEADAQ